MHNMTHDSLVDILQHYMTFYAKCAAFIIETEIWIKYQVQIIHERPFKNGPIG